MKFGILFSGQGAQRPGMGIDLMADPLFASTIQEASEAVGMDLLPIMKNENGALEQTKNVQPALVAVSYGLYKMLMRDLNLQVGGMIGLSLGEYAALLASQGLEFKNGMALLADRARYMQAVADETPSAMAALLKPDVEAVEAICDQVTVDGNLVSIANYNTPKQVVIGGTVAGVKAASDQVKATKVARRAIELPVSGAFHTALFNPARDQMVERLKAVPVQDPQVPVISNTTEEPFAASSMKTILAKQLAVPTHFGAGLKKLTTLTNLDATLELGPGKTLTRFAQVIVPDLKHYHISNLAEYQAFVTEVENGTDE